jgi:hypothetical protein
LNGNNSSPTILSPSFINCSATFDNAIKRIKFSEKKIEEQVKDFNQKIFTKR